MRDALSNDEYDALAQIANPPSAGRPSACVARNVKRLAGLKFVAYAKNGTLQISEKGAQALFLRSCIDGLRAVLLDPHAPLSTEVSTFLGKKGHVVACQETGGLALTTRARESLADIDLHAS